MVSTHCNIIIYVYVNYTSAFHWCGIIGNAELGKRQRYSKATIRFAEIAQLGLTLPGTSGINCADGIFIYEFRCTN